jgi:hypothetical protein
MATIISRAKKSSKKKLDIRNKKEKQLYILNKSFNKNSNLDKSLKALDNS